MKNPNNILQKYINNENRNSNFTGYTLDNIKQLLNHFNNPHLNLNCIHIAGTNGKGTVANILNKTYTNNNYKTGLYTSPHLLSVNERIKINNENISNDELYEIILKIDRVCLDHNINLTYFDILTASAFIYFYDNNCSPVIIECGLGGRLDSTNICTPILSIITDISKDHTSILGANISDIAYEKSGIIKNNTPVYTSNVSQQILQIIKEQSVKMNSKLSTYNDLKFSNIKHTKHLSKFSLLTDKREYQNIKYKNLAPFQFKNISTAIRSLEILESNFKFDIGKFYDLILNFSITGRFEIIKKEPVIIFDAAHNQQSLEMLISSLKIRFSETKFKIFITLMKDKNPLSLINFLETHLTNDIVYINLKDKRNFKPNDNFNYKIIDANNHNEIYNNIDNSKVNVFSGSFRLYDIVTLFTSK